MSELLGTAGSENPTQSPADIQKELDSIKQQAIANGTFMKAPNGQPTKLNERQWLQVRTKAFKEWFGDWEIALLYDQAQHAWNDKIVKTDLTSSHLIVQQLGFSSC